VDIDTQGAPVWMDAIVSERMGQERARAPEFLRMHSEAVRRWAQHEATAVARAAHAAQSASAAGNAQLGGSTVGTQAQTPGDASK
jgi:hypothetical protein